MPNGIEGVMRRRVYGAGEVIFRQGGEARCAWVVQEGEVEISRTVGGQRRVLYTVGRNGIVGQNALIDGQPFMADATAKQATSCQLISREQFERKMNAADPFVRALVRIIVGNVRTTLASGALPELGQP